MGDEYTAEQRQQLERQIAYFQSDDRIREEVAAWADASPEERIAAFAEMCTAGEYFLAQLPPDVLARVLRPDPIPPESIAVLEALRRDR